MAGEQLLHFGNEGAKALKGATEHEYRFARVRGVPGERLIMQGPGAYPDDAGRIVQVLWREVGLVTHGGFSGRGSPFRA